MTGVELFTIGETAVTLSDVASVVGTGLSAISSITGARAQEAQAKSQQNMLNYKAEQARVQAGQQRAASQRTAAEQRRRAAIVSSNARAAAATSGGSVSDPTVQNIIGNIEGEGEYRALTSLYQGEDAARGMETQANLWNYEGDQYAQAGETKSSSTLFSGIAGLPETESFKTLRRKWFD